MATGSATMTSTMSRGRDAALGCEGMSVVRGSDVAANSTIAPATASIVANGSSTQVITVQARDANNNNLTTGGATVVISKSGTGSLSATTDNSNGTYTATLTSPTATGSATMTASFNAADVGAPDSSVVTFIAGAAVA